jgi:N6-L-threonylcarbamoyladenine synthase
MAEFLTLGIETSCDETSAAVIADGRKILSNIISSQLDIHTKFGGVVPEIAARCHLETILPVYRSAMEKAGVTLDDIDLIAVTYGPGLIGSLLVGLSFAKGLALAGKKDLVGVNHIEGHIYANILERPQLEPPLICLTVSGGHTDLVYLENWGRYHVLGRTRDDAAGEAFDKIARVLGLGYPGGPAIDKIAVGARDDLQFMRSKPMAGTYDFSFSGLKTAVINYLNRQKQIGETIDIPRVAASFQRAVVEQLTEKLFRAAIDYRVKTVLLSGGVSANSRLRNYCSQEADRLGMGLYYPPLRLCTDNAGMIAAAGYYVYKLKGPGNLEITAQPGLGLPSVDN